MRPAIERIIAGVEPSTRAMPPGRTAAAKLPSSDTISGAFAMQSLAQTLPDDAIILEETPSHRNVLHDYLPIAKPGGFFAAASGSLGWALPAAIGAALAAPGRRIVALVGDGSSLYSIQGLWTAARLGLPISFVVLNNRAYGAMNEFSRYLRFEGAPSFDLRGCDFVSVARGFGVDATRAERGEDLLAALQESFATETPTLVEVVVEDPIGVIY
jgi:benzoylformate decarboxylase